MVTVGTEEMCRRQDHSFFGSLVVIKVDRSTSSQDRASAFSAVSSRLKKKPFSGKKVNGCLVILLLLILYNTLVSVTELFAKDRKYDDLLPYLTCRGTSHGHHHQQFWEVFTARCHASAVLAMGLCPSVCVCVCQCLSATSRCSTKTAKRRITQTTPHDTPGTLVF